MSENNITEPVLDPKSDPRWNYPGDYWDGIEAALVGLPESDPLRAYGLACFDHLKARVLTNAVTNERSAP